MKYMSNREKRGELRVEPINRPRKEKITAQDGSTEPWIYYPDA
jgi:hypothetical protein